MITIPKTPTTQRKESGMVAIMVTLILMIVLSLIVLGFAQISRRNQRQALDRQLSTQAFYAAETAVNDVAALIEASGAAAVADKPDCASNGGGYYTSLTSASVIDATNEVEYTCLLVDPTPDELSYTDIGTTGTVVPVIASSGTIASIRLTWQTKDVGTNWGGTGSPAALCLTNATTLPAAGAWGNCGYGMLRFDLVPTTGSGLTMGGLQNSTITSFVLPLRPGGTGATANPISYPTPPNGANNRLAVVCSSTNCTLTINGLTQAQYHMRISSLYKPVSLRVAAFNGSGGAIGLQSAQAIVDATGRAQDVLRRIQVRLPLSASGPNLLGDYAIQSSEALCKRFSIMDGHYQPHANADLGTAGFPGLAASTTNPLCD